MEQFAYLSVLLAIIVGFSITQILIGFRGVLLTQTIVQYLLAAVVFPDFSGDQAIDLRRHYWQHTRWFFALLIFLLLVSLTKDLVMTGRMTGALNLLFHLGFMTMAVAAMLTPAEKFHRLLPLCGIAIFVAYIIALFTPLR
jgi:hypothetical protein